MYKYTWRLKTVDYDLLADACGLSLLGLWMDVQHTEGEDAVTEEQNNNLLTSTHTL